VESLRELRGVVVFMPTPFTSNDDVDVEAVARQVSRLSRSSDVAAVVVAGGVGEYHALSIDEHVELIEVAVHASAGTLPVIAGTASDTKRSIIVARAVARSGAAGLLMNPLAFVASSMEQLIRHFGAVAEASGRELIAFGTPSTRLSAGDLAGLVTAVPAVSVYKDETGDIGEFLRIVRAIGDRLLYMNGMAEPMAAVYPAAGALVTASGLANALAPATASLWRAAVEGDHDRVAALSDLFHPLLELRSRIPGHTTAVLKALINASHDADFRLDVRSPLRPLDDEEQAELRRALDAFREQGFATTGD
jgi:5-dehydro-4-deoxyglucarate dehydratase